MKDLLMVVGKQYLNGLKKGWFDKSVTNDVKSRVEFVDQNDIVNSNITLHTVPTYRGKDLYIKDSHSNVYVSMDDDNIEKLFITSQCNAVKEALVRMGAKRITIKKAVKDV